MYGINTGFGKLANVRIASDQLDQLQINLIRSHAAGVGDPLPAAVVRAVMLLRANVLLRPTSGVRPELVDALVAMLNAGVVPLVPEQGSVGASGDLAPLSHIGLALMGEGEVLADEGRAPARRSRGRAAHALPFRPERRHCVHQRDPGADRAAGAYGARRKGPLAYRRRCGRDEPGGPAGHTRAARSPHPRGPSPPGTDRGGRSHASACSRTARSGSLTGRTIPGCRTRTA